jgi:hypothetical protein
MFAKMRSKGRLLAITINMDLSKTVGLIAVLLLVVLAAAHAMDENGQTPPTSSTQSQKQS